MSKKSIRSIADNLEKIRKQKKYSLERVSKLSDLSLNTVAKIESGKNTNPTIDTLQKLASALEVGVDDLIKPLNETN